MRQPHSDIGNADLVRGPFPGACGLFTVMGAKPDDGRVLGAENVSVAKQIEVAGIPSKKNPEIEVQYIVATEDLGTKIDLERDRDPRESREI